MSPWPKGRPRSDADKKKFAQAHRGKRLSAQTRTHQSEAHRTSLVLAADRVGRTERRRG
jgi:hypothetical protein